MISDMLDWPQTASDQVCLVAGPLFQTTVRGPRQFPPIIPSVPARFHFELILQADVERQDFLKMLAESCQKNRFLGHACCLMPTHSYLAVEARGEPGGGDALAVEQLRNPTPHRHKLTGHVLSERYKARRNCGSGPGARRSRYGWRFGGGGMPP